jgi:hypothetical protein
MTPPQNNHSEQKGEQTHTGFGFADPNDDYEFEIEVGTNPARPDRMPHRVIAHRRYTTVENIEAVDITLPALKSALSQLIEFQITGKDGALSNHGITISTIFESGSCRGYIPIGVCLNGQPIRDYDIDSSGFWEIPNQLIDIIEHQSPRTVTNTQIPFNGRQQHTQHPTHGEF